MLSGCCGSQSRAPGLRRGAAPRASVGGQVCDPQRTPCKLKPENCFDIPVLSGCCGSQSRAPGLRRGEAFTPLERTNESRVCENRETALFPTVTRAEARAPQSEGRDGSSPFGPPLRQTAGWPDDRANPLQARRAGIFVASPSQTQFKLRRNGIALPRTERLPISRLRSGVSGERRMSCLREPYQRFGNSAKTGWRNGRVPRLNR